MFNKILIANRGEIALRIHRACREMGIHTVAVHSTADAEAMYVRLADESVCIGPPSSSKSYLHIPNLIAAAEITGAEAIHPGYGFLAENADFADIVKAHGITFIGPSADHIRLMGDKITAKKTIAKLGIPVVPGSGGAVVSVGEAREAADKIGYPVLLKASAGGGGRGMGVVESEKFLEETFTRTRAEAKAAFGSDVVYLEKYLSHPRHIEFQILADSHGNVVHLGERDCSLQRRHQKILEESPSPVITSQERQKMGTLLCQAMKSLGYLGVGTIEFLYQDGAFYFIEMNTRIQVEHPVTEMVTGIDIIREQIQIAEGLPLSFTQADVRMNGHAIECRINAEDSRTFKPSPGKVTDFHTPGGLGVRVDSAIYSGFHIPPSYDSLIAKLIVHGDNRNDCVMRLRRALEEFVIGGIETTIPLHLELLSNDDFLAANYDIKWLEKFIANKANA